MLQELSILETGVVFLRIQEDKEFGTDQVTTLQVINTGYASVFVNELEIKVGEKHTLVPFDNTLSKVDLSIRFADVDTSIPAFTWNKKEITIIYKKLIRCKN